MGAFMIFDISFEKEEDRKRFEEKYKVRKKDILVSNDSESYGTAWTYLRNPTIDVIYFMGFMGYGDPDIILKECLKGIKLDNKINKSGEPVEYWTKPVKEDIIKIKFLSWLPINDKNSKWEKIRGRW